MYSHDNRLRALAEQDLGVEALIDILEGANGRSARSGNTVDCFRCCHCSPGRGRCSPSGSLSTIATARTVCWHSNSLAVVQAKLQRSLLCRLSTMQRRTSQTNKTKATVRP